MTQAPQRWEKLEPDQMLKHRPDTSLAASKTVVRVSVPWVRIPPPPPPYNILISLDKLEFWTPNFFKYSRAFQECSPACFAGRDHLVPFGRESERRRLVFSVRRLSIPKIPSGRIWRDSEHCDMIWIDDRDHESAVVDRWIAIQVA